MFRRRLSVALTLGAALVAITACSTNGTPTAASSGPGGAARTDASTMPAPGKLLATVKSAANGASAVHIKGAFTDSGSQESLDMQLNKDGSATGTVGDSGTIYPITTVNKVYYFQFTSGLMSGNGIDPSSAAGKALMNKWVPSTSPMLAGTGMVDSLKPATDYNTLVPQLFDQFEGTPKATGTGNVDGYPVHTYTFDDGSIADVASAAPHYLIRIAEPASEGKGSLDFTGWNKPVTVTAPPATEIYSGSGS